MKWISNLFSRYWCNVHFIIVAVLSLMLVFGGSRLKSTVSGALITVFHYPFAKIRDTIVELSVVAEANRRLQLALVEASVRLSQLEEAERENTRLRAIHGYGPAEGYTLTRARVISVVGEQVPIAITISCGHSDSIMVDQPLVNEQGLIGRVAATFQNVASVQLLTDPAHRVAVRVADSRDMGIVRYHTGEGFILDNLPTQSSIEEGALILSSGLGGIYPPGLSVGKVVFVEHPEEEPFCKVRLEPAVNFNSLEGLFVLRAASQ